MTNLLLPSNPVETPYSEVSSFANRLDILIIFILAASFVLTVISGGISGSVTTAIVVGSIIFFIALMAMVFMRPTSRVNELYSSTNADEFSDSPQAIQDGVAAAILKDGYLSAMVLWNARVEESKILYQEKLEAEKNSEFKAKTRG